MRRLAEELPQSQSPNQWHDLIPTAFVMQQVGMLESWACELERWNGTPARGWSVVCTNGETVRVDAQVWANPGE